MSLEELVLQSTRLSEKTKTLYAARVRDFLEFSGGQLTSYALESWRDSLVRNGLSAKSINLYMCAVRYASKRYAAINHNPTLDFAAPAEMIRVIGDKHPKQYALTKDQCRALLDTCADPDDPVALRDRAMIMVGLYAAFRRTEITSVQFEDVDLTRNRLTTRAKGGKPHTVSISPVLRQALIDWLSCLRRHGIHTSGPIFRGINCGKINDREITPGGFYSILKRRGAECGIEQLHPHALRHTFVWLALQAGVPVWRVQLVLGHKSKLMTLYYAEDLSADAVGSGFDL